jgi:DNA-binding NtrC family response regulator
MMGAAQAPQHGQHGNAAAPYLALDGRTRDIFRTQDIYPPDRPSRRRSGRKVLVVDDQPEALQSTVDIFREMGYDVLQAGSGEDAIEVLGRTPDIEVLFTDVFMPRMDGVHLGREARKLVPGINVILVSGFPASAMDLHAGEPGEFHFLMKPFLMSEVAIVLRR